MGGGSINQNKIRRNELMELSKMTLFPNDLIFLLHSFFHKYASSIKDDGVIDYNEFLGAIKMPNNTFTKHLYCSFDQNKDNNVNFREFLKFFATFFNGNSIGQTEISFKLFANPKTKKIDKPTMLNILIDGINENEKLKKYLTEEDIIAIVNHTFDYWIKPQQNQSPILKQSPIPTESHDKLVSETNNFTLNISRAENSSEEDINYELYCEIFNSNENIKNWLRMNLDKIKSYARHDLGSCCF